MSNRTVRILVTLISVSAIVCSIYVLYRSVQANGYSSGVASGIATLGLVVVTIWYARSTGKLTNLTQEQIKATKMGYAPNLNVEIDLQEDNLVAEIENTGNGPARSLTIDFDVIHNQTAYRYRAKFKSDVGENSIIKTPDKDKVVLTPEFEVPKVDPNVGTGRKVLEFAFGRFDNTVRGMSEVKKYGELIEQFRSDYEDYSEVFPPVHCTVRYTDIAEEKSYSEEKLQNHRASLSDNSLKGISEANQFMHGIHQSPDTRLEYLQNFLLGNGDSPSKTIMRVEEIETESTSS